MSVGLDGPWRPGGWQAPLAGVTVVEVREVDPPDGVQEPLHGYFDVVALHHFGARRGASWGVIRRGGGSKNIIKRSRAGTGVEESQLERAYRLEPLMAVLAVVAVRLLSAKMLARSRPESFEAAPSFGPQMLDVLEKKLGRPKGGWTNRNVLIQHRGAFGRIYGAQGRWNARLADHLARLAAADVDV